MSYKNISEETDTEIAVRLTREKKLASIPLSVFYHNKTDNRLLRFCFAKKDETLLEGLRRLETAVADFRKERV